MAVCGGEQGSEGMVGRAYRRGEVAGERKGKATWPKLGSTSEPCQCNESPTTRAVSKLSCESVPEHSPMPETVSEAAQAMMPPG